MKKIWLWLYAGAASLCFLLLYCVLSLGDGKLHVYFLDVGQGDAILIRTPNSHLILVDGGPDEKVLQELSAVLPFYERTIDTIVLTHPHADHVDGLVRVLKRYSVRDVLLTGVSSGYPAYKEFMSLAEAKGATIHIAHASQDFRAGNVFLDVVYPIRTIAGQKFANLNNSSIAFRLLYGESAFFLSGDLEREGEEKLAESGENLHADLLKAGHHGSRTASSPALLDLVNPEVGVISCGVDNSFKHPHPETIEAYMKRRYAILRTDINGRVELMSDGSFIQFLPAV